MTSYDYDYMSFLASYGKSKETDYNVNYWIPMREENQTEVAISLLWNVFIHFIFMSKMEGEIPLLYRMV